MKFKILVLLLIMAFLSTENVFGSEDTENYKTVILKPDLPELDLSSLGTIKLEDKCNKMANEDPENSTYEAWSEQNRLILKESKGWWNALENGFVSAIRIAYDYHIPLAFSPDDLWTLIIQGVGQHINANPEGLRAKFVRFEDKKILEIETDDTFVKGENNDWSKCFETWAEQIETYVGEENKKILVPEFSTNTKLSTACANLAFMEAMKSYFGYELHTSCGIRAVKLLGTLEDWEKLLENVGKLREYNLDWWIDYIEPVVKNIVKTYQGEEVEELFWQSIYKHYSSNGSGTVSTVDGWIVNFFPYMKTSRNTKLVSLETLYERATLPTEGDKNSFKNPPGMAKQKVPCGITQTPFKWHYLHEDTYNMEIQSGFIGAEMNEDAEIGRYVQPVMFWAVRQSSEWGISVLNN